MNFFLGFALVLCAHHATVLAKPASQYEFTNEQVNCKLTENNTKLLCNLSGNVECDIDSELPESITKNKDIDMLVVGFDKGSQNLDSLKLQDIKFNLYTSNVNEKELTKAPETLQLYLGTQLTTKGFMVKDKKCYDELTQKFKVVTMIKKTQEIKIKGSTKADAKALIFGEILLNNQTTEEE